MAGTSAPTAMPAISQDTSSSLSALFAKKEDSDLSRGSYVMGGLLGLRGVPKMPSFKVGPFVKKLQMFILCVVSCSKHSVHHGIL